MSNKSKGKDVVHPQIQTPETTAQGTPALPGRIGASASGLLQSSFGRPSLRSAADTLASLNADAGKGAPASSTPNVAEASSSSQAFSSRGGNVASEQCSTEETFRSEQGRRGITTQNGQVEFDEFVARPHRLDPDSQALDDEFSPSVQKAAHSHIQEQYNGSNPAQEEANSERILARSEQQSIHNNDGAAVVALLADPGFSAETDPNDSVTSMAPDNCGYLLGEKQQRKSIDPSDPRNPLDLVPGFDSSWKTARLPNHFYQDSTLNSNFGDIQPWAEILDRYHDEVWGDMLPLVKEARKELEAAKASPEGALQNRPAIRRLGMLVKHLNYPMG